MSTRNVDNSVRSVMYIYDLPYQEMKMICNILDINDKWEELGGMYMKYDCGTLHKISKAVLRNRSPTEELLCVWGTQNHTVLDLFVLLAKMHHYQAMRILKPFVDAKYHHLIYEGEEHESQLVSAGDSNTLKENLMNNEMRNKSRTESEKPKSRLKEENVKDHGSKGKLQNATSTAVMPELCTLHISYKELELSTDGWNKSNILGKGGFGVVFKGTWKNTAVAIKRLEVQRTEDEKSDALEIQLQQSLRELRYLNSYRHDNILPLYGYSIDGEKCCLVYQYMPNGSLEHRIQSRNKTKPLSWFLRHKIATGTARGLQFLHGMSTPLVHGDIKSANILLDPYFEPRIGDFGLAREGPLEQYTHVKVSRVHGTRPYLPDEFLREKKFSTHVDTYSFGVVLFEIATGLRAYDDTRSKRYLKDYVDEYDESRTGDLIDAKAGKEDSHIFSGLIALGKWCVKRKPKERPNMVQVLQQLDGMMVAHDMANKAQFRLHQNNPSNSIPYEPQLLHDYYTHLRRMSVSPSATYHPQPWLFASHLAINAAPIAGRSPSPTHRTIDESSPHHMGGTPIVMINNPMNEQPIQQVITASTPMKIPQMVSVPAYTSYATPPPHINIIQPPVMSKLSDYNSSMSDSLSEQDVSVSIESRNTASSEQVVAVEEINRVSMNNDLDFSRDQMLPEISELKINGNSCQK